MIFHGNIKKAKKKEEKKKKKERKKRSTQTLFTRLQEFCIKIFTSCCLMQKVLLHKPKNKIIMIVKSSHSLNFGLFPRSYLSKKRKTEHTIISHTSRNSEHQNIHVMLSYAKQTNTKKKPKKTKRIVAKRFLK